MRRDNDVVAAITGDTGSGKSSLAVLLARVLQDKPVQVDQQFLWSAQALGPAARSLPEYSCIVMDEAIVGGGNRRRAMSGDNVGVMEHLNTCRTYHQTVLFLAPQFGDLDTSIQTRCRWQLHVTKRGEVKFIEWSKAGGPNSRKMLYSYRFTDKFPDPATHENPEVRQLWRDYKAAKDRFSFHGSDPNAAARLEFFNHCRRVIRSTIRDG